MRTPTRPMAALAVLAALALVVLSPIAPAAAGTTPRLPVAPAAHIEPQADCLIVSGNTYQVVFAYDNSGESTVNLPVGASNTLTPASLNGQQPTTFLPGNHHAAFTTSAVPVGTTVTWTVDGFTYNAADQGLHCAAPVSLPADGNGTAAALVVVLSLIGIAVAAYRLRRRQPV